MITFLVRCCPGCTGPTICTIGKCTTPVSALQPLSTLFTSTLQPDLQLGEQHRASTPFLSLTGATLCSRTVVVQIPETGNPVLSRSGMSSSVHPAPSRYTLQLFQSVKTVFAAWPAGDGLRIELHDLQQDAMLDAAPAKCVQRGTSVQVMGCLQMSTSNVVM